MVLVIVGSGVNVVLVKIFFESLVFSDFFLVFVLLIKLHQLKSVEINYFD